MRNKKVIEGPQLRVVRHLPAAFCCILTARCLRECIRQSLTRTDAYLNMTIRLAAKVAFHVGLIILRCWLSWFAIRSGGQDMV